MDEFSLSLTDTEWRKVGAYANSLIQNDMTAGKFQNGKSNLQYLSQAYKRYKANGMRRLTRDTKSGTKKAGINKKTGFTTGKRVGQKVGTIESTNTAFVDMTLTEELKKSLVVKGLIPNGVECEYTRDNAEKIILGNNKYGRQIVGLSEENITKVKRFIDEILIAKFGNLERNIIIEVNY